MTSDQDLFHCLEQLAEISVFGQVIKFLPNSRLLKSFYNGLQNL